MRCIITAFGQRRSQKNTGADHRFLTKMKTLAIFVGLRRVHETQKHDPGAKHHRDSDND
jgi:hypothetical protein